MEEKHKKIEKILVENIGWVYSFFSDNTNSNGKTASQPIEVFFVNGEMAPITWYRKGRDEMCTAGEDMQRWSMFGITADIFESDGVIEIPLIDSENPGSGKLDSFLQELKKEAGEKKIQFNTVVNQGLIKHLAKNGIAYN